MKKKIEIAPSILSADFSNLEKDIKIVEKENIHRLHLDVMDGHFVPNITFGPPLVESIRKKTKLILESHLMIKEPMKYIKPFKDAGSDIIIVHKEVLEDLNPSIDYIKSLGIKAGVSINPETSWETVKNILHKIDLILIMTVNPGFGAQKFIEPMLDKITAVSEYIKAQKLNLDIEVDGGINKETISLAYKAGANIFVAGSSVFKAKDISLAIKELKSIITDH